MNSPTSTLEFSSGTSHQVTIIKRHRIQTLRSLHRATTSCALDDGVLYDDALYEDSMEPRRLDVDLQIIDSTNHDTSSDNFDGIHESIQQNNEGDFEAKHTLNHNVAALRIQKFYQKHRQKQKMLHTSHLIRIKSIVQRHKTIQHVSASKIQSVYREYSARMNSINLQKQRVLWCVYGIAATRIQKAYRGHLVRTVMRCIYEIAAMRIQMAYRNYVNKMSMQYRNKLSKIVPCQYLMRSKFAMRHYENKTHAVIQIQACCRGYIQRKKYHGTISGMQLYRSAISRGANKMDSIRAVKSCNEHELIPRRQPFYPRKGFFLALKLQALYRGCKTREVLATAMASTMIQSCWRMYSSRHAHILKMSEGKEMASILIQANWRSYSCRNFYLWKLAEKERASILIQSQWRSFSCHSAYLLNMMDIIIVQSVMRRWLASRKVYQTRCNLPNSNELISVDPAPSPSFGSAEFVDLSETSAAVLAAIVNLDKEQLRTVDDDGSYGNCDDIAECDHDEENQFDQKHQQRQKYDLIDGCTARSVNANESECILHDEETDRVIPQDKAFTMLDAGIVQSVLWQWIRQQSENTVASEELKGCDSELVEDLSFFCRNVSLKEEMNEIQQSLKEEMEDLKVMSFGTRWLGAIWNREGRAATLIQSLWRGFSCRKMLEQKRKASVLIQSLWRGYSCRNAFTSTMTDVILAQSTIRRWLSCKQLNEMRNLSGETHHDIDALNKVDSDDLPIFCCHNMNFEGKMDEVQTCLKEEMLELESICCKLFG